MALMLVQGSLFPLIVPGSLFPLLFYSAGLSCLWFVQGSLFPLFSVQQACLAYALFKGLCSFFLVLLVSNVFLIYTILTFDKKKKRELLGSLERETRERSSPSPTGIVSFVHGAS
jgi:hypothetical protein